MSFNLKDIFASGTAATLEVNTEAASICSEFLEQVLRKMDEICEVETTFDAETGAYHANIIGGDSGRIIGRKGETLDALRYLAKAALNRGLGGAGNIHIELDTAGYAKKRKEAIYYMVSDAIRRMERSGRDGYQLETMSAYDRRIAHEAVATHEGWTSTSVGTGSGRRVQIVRASA